MNSKSELLRKKLDEKPLIRVIGAYDAMSAKLIEITGFDAIWAGSFAISATHALPDASILTMTEFLAASANMADSCNIPVIADCDTGFGGPNNVSHMVKKYENAGIAAICIEDKMFPKQNSLLNDSKQDLLPEKDFVAKILAAKNAKQNKDFMIIARIESFIAGLGLDEALKRATAYEKAGADAILIHSKKNTPEEIFSFCDSWDGNIPISIVPTTYSNTTIDEFQSHNIRMVIYANQTLRAAYVTISRLLNKMSNSQSLDDIKEEMVSMEDIFKLQKMYEIKKEEQNIEDDLRKLGYIN